MRKIILHHHLGLGDHFICNGLVRKLKSSLALDLLILPVKEHNLTSVAALYAEQDGIELMPLPRSAYPEEDAYIISQSKILEIPVLKISYNGSQNIAFDASFYIQMGFDLDVSWSHFHPPPQTSDSLNLYKRLIKHDHYCLVANAGSVGKFDIDVDTELPVYQLSQDYSNNLFDWSEIIARAKEIHCIDSSVIHLVDRMPTSAEKLVYHNVGRGSKFHLKKNWERKAFMGKGGSKKALQRVFDTHFEALPDEHILELRALNLRILNPRKSTPKFLHSLLERFVKKSRKKGYSKWRHVCHYSFERLVLELASFKKEIKILETGSSAHGTNSSKLFFEIIDLLGGEFDTVDLNPEATQRVQSLLEQGFPHLMDRVHCNNGDSVEFIRDAQGPFDVVYLDSYDLYPGIFKESEQHGLSEFTSIVDKLSDIAYVLIDDSPRTRSIFDKMNTPEFMSAVDSHVQIFGHLPGKGALVLQAVTKDPRFTILHHEYQLLLKFQRNQH